jgi:hypothetical protein
MATIPLWPSAVPLRAQVGSQPSARLLDCGDAVSDLETRIAKALEDDDTSSVERPWSIPLLVAARELLPEAATELSQLRAELKALTEAANKCLPEDAGEG